MTWHACPWCSTAKTQWLVEYVERRTCQSGIISYALLASIWHDWSTSIETRHHSTSLIFQLFSCPRFNTSTPTFFDRECCPSWKPHVGSSSTEAGHQHTIKETSVQVSTQSTELRTTAVNRITLHAFCCLLGLFKILESGLCTETIIKSSETVWEFNILFLTHK